MIDNSGDIGETVVPPSDKGRHSPFRTLLDRAPLILAASTVVLAGAYVLLRLVYTAFYAKLNVTIEQVGLSYEILVGSLAVGVILAVLASAVWFVLSAVYSEMKSLIERMIHRKSLRALAIVVLGSLLLWASDRIGLISTSDEPRPLTPTERWLGWWFLAGVIAGVLEQLRKRLAPAWMTEVRLRNWHMIVAAVLFLLFPLVAANRVGADYGEIVRGGRALRPPLLFQQMRADPVRLIWLDGKEKCAITCKQPLLYLGETNTYLVLYEPKTHRPIRVPTGVVVVLPSN